MATCDVCGKRENLPYNCRHCNGTYCATHRLPENHDCSALYEWNDPKGVFDSGFDDSVGGASGRSQGTLERLGIDTGPGGFVAYFRGNTTYVFLIAMWVTFLLQFVAAATLPREAQLSIFYLTTANPEFVWTWITSIFAHGGLGHIVVNSIVIFFFGPLVERYIGSQKFAILFVASGVLAGLGQVGLSIANGEPAAVLGASGAGLAILGILTVLNPSLRVYLYFILPVPIWAITGFYALYSVFWVSTGAAGAGGTAHAAHLIGLLIGLGYGQYVKKQGVRAPNQIQFGGGPGGPGGPGRRRGPF